MGGGGGFKCFDYLGKLYLKVARLSTGPCRLPFHYVRDYRLVESVVCPLSSAPAWPRWSFLPRSRRY